MTRKQLGKRLLNIRALHGVLSLLMSLIIRFIYLTNRVEKHFPEAAQPYLRGEKPAIFCFWHGRMILHPFLKPPGRNMYVLMSKHNDGALVTFTMRWFGIGSVRGSRNKNGAHALRELFKVTEAGGNICITPDGPRGPFQKAAIGAAYIASKTGYPILPIAFSASRHRRFHKSWDKFMLPRFFSRVAFVAATPITVEPEADEATLTAATSQLEAELTRVTHAADQHCGVQQ